MRILSVFSNFYRRDFRTLRLTCLGSAFACFKFVVGFFLCVLISHQVEAHGAYHEVLRELRPKIEQDPSNVELRLKLVEAHVDHDEWKAALAELDRIEKLAPGKHPLGYLRGRSLAVAKRWVKAKEELDGYITQFPDHEEAHSWRARVRMELGDKEGANDDYRNACRTSRNPEYHAEFAKSLAKQGLADQSVTALQHALKLNPDDPALLECMVECATTAKDTPAGLAAIDRLIKTWPRPEPWMLRRAKLLAATDQKDEALAAWNALALHLKSLSNFDRAQPFLMEIETETNAALGIKAPTPVIAPPAPSVSE